VTASIPEVFEERARAVLADHSQLNPSWSAISEGEGRELVIPKQEDSGFDVVVWAETYGLHVFADDWHSGPWEPVPSDPRPLTEQVFQLCDEFLGFVRTLLSEDASLAVHYARGRPFRWVLTYETESGPESETCALIIFNYFGSRSVRTFRNRHLPRRYDAATRL
jgi:hypothetical protein